MTVKPRKHPPRRLHFIGSNDYADPIRGRAYFEHLARHHPDNLVTVHYDRALTIDVDRCGLFVIVMPASEAISEFFEYIATKPCGCRTIVDAHADFWTPSDRPGFGDVDWWESDGHIVNLERCMKAADAVTVPEPWYVDSVMTMNPRVAIVPDSPGGHYTEEVAWAWQQAIMIASLSRRSADSLLHEGRPEATDPMTGQRFSWNGVRWESVGE